MVQFIDATGRLFGGHVEGSPQDLAVHGAVGTDSARIELSKVLARVCFVNDLRDAPVDHDHLSKAVDRNILRLEVAMNHLARMSVTNRLANVDEVSQQSADKHPVVVAFGPALVILHDRVMQCRLSEEAHHVEGLPGTVFGSKLVDRDDPRMRQASGDHGFTIKTLDDRG